MIIPDKNSMDFDENQKETVTALSFVALIFVLTFAALGIHMCCKFQRKRYILFKSNKITQKDIKILFDNYKINLNDYIVGETKVEYTGPKITENQWKDLSIQNDFTLIEDSKDDMKLFTHKNINNTIFPLLRKMPCANSNFFKISTKSLLNKCEVISSIERTLYNVSSNVIYPNVINSLNPAIKPTEDVIMIEPWMYNYISKYCNSELDALVKKNQMKNSLYFKFEGPDSEEVCEAVSTYVQKINDTITMKIINFTNSRRDLIEKANRNMPTDLNYVLLENSDHSFMIIAPKTTIDQVIKELKAIDLNKSPEKKEVKKTHELKIDFDNSKVKETTHFIPLLAPVPLNSDIKINEKHKEEYKLPNGLIIKIVLGNLIKENCDAIINPANRKLKHSGGAARTIADAAGPDLINECNDYIKANGQLQIGGVCITTAGMLKSNISFVMHVVGPRSSDYNYKELLNYAILNVLTTAEDRKFEIISIPAISSGIFGVPKHEVAQIFLCSLLSFDKLHSRRYLKTVRLTNFDKETTDIFLNIFHNNFFSYANNFELYCNNSSLPMYKDEESKNEGDNEDKLFSTSINLIDILDTNDFNFKAPKPLLPSLNNSYDGRSLVEASSLQQSAEENCVICMDEINNPKKLPCGHTFCAACIDNSFKLYQPKCPSCNKIFGMLKGNQPNGKMFSFEDRNLRLPGYEDCHAINIVYTIFDGIQSENHPHPGMQFNGTKRQAYLPANEEGKNILRMLTKAFDEKLIFTIGRSHTSGKDDQVIWNDIHHKTRVSGTHGYPDPDYLKNVADELARKGIY